MSKEKKDIREQFRRAVFIRDGMACRVCGQKDGEMDAHHITPREQMPNGGYVKENGITVCGTCHIKAEVCIDTELVLVGWTQPELYALIGSSYEAAVKASENL